MRYHLIFIIELIFLFSSLTNAKCIVYKNNKGIIKNIKDTIPEIEIDYRFANTNEAAALALSNHEYYEKMNQNDLDYRLQKFNGTSEEMMQFGIDQVLNFTDEEKMLIDKEIDYIKKISKERGYSLPSAKNIIFVKTTMIEENSAVGYTHGTQIYMGDKILELAKEEEEEFHYFMGHELFHCLTRNNPDFRKDMYKLIGFAVLDKDFEFSKEIADRLISNPDVEHHNSYATFEIKGEKKDCVAILTTSKPFEKPGDNFFDNSVIGLVPIDNLNTMYTSEDITNLLGVYGEEERDIEDPEEVMADNFGELISYGPEKEIHKKIDEYLKSYKSSKQ